MIKQIRMKFYGLVNRWKRRNGPSLADQSAIVIARVSSLQLEREETKELAPTPGAIGPMLISGGAVTKIQYKVFDRHADKLDKAIKQEPWRAYADVTMRVYFEKDPEFTASIEGQEIEVKGVHSAPGYALLKALANYFPLLPRPHAGPVIKPETA